MGFSSGPTGAAIASSSTGIVVVRDATNLPQGTAVPIFSVVGGAVIIRQIVGEVTTILGGSLNNAKLTVNPTIGPLQDLCAILNIGFDPIGTRYNITGVFTDSMVKSGVVLQAQGYALLVVEGTIDLDCTSSLPGQIKWFIVYDPVDPGTTVEVA